MLKWLEEFAEWVHIPHLEKRRKKWYHKKEMGDSNDKERRKHNRHNL